MSSPYILNKIRAFCEDNPDLIIIGAGDVKQLPSIEPYTNCQNVDEYVDTCIDIIFKHNIFLKISKRVGDKDTEEGEINRKKLDKMYDDWFVKEMDVEEWILKHHKMTRDVMTSENNIAYTNMRCQAVSSHQLCCRRKCIYDDKAVKYLVQVRDDVEAGDEKMKELEQEMKNWVIFDTDFCLGDIMVDEEDNEPPEERKKN